MLLHPLISCKRLKVGKNVWKQLPFYKYLQKRSLQLVELFSLLCGQCPIVKRLTLAVPFCWIQPVAFISGCECIWKHLASSPVGISSHTLKTVFKKQKNPDIILFSKWIEGEGISNSQSIHEDDYQTSEPNFIANIDLQFNFSGA